MVGPAVAVVFAVLPAIVLAYPNTHPVVAWSSHSSQALSAPAVSQAAKMGSHAVAHALYTHDDICSHDAVVVVDHSGLHASDLRGLSSSCHTAKALSNAPSSLHLAYVGAEDRIVNPFVDLSGMLSKRCGSHAVSHSPDHGELAIDTGKGKHVVTISLPTLEDGEAGASRKDSMANHESWLSGELSKIEATFSNYLVVYSGSPASMLHARQSSIGTTFEDTRVAAAPSGGILKRYQLLTPGLILVLLIALFVLVPVIFFGVSALSSIQSPLTNEIPKGFSAEEKKNQ